MKRRNVVIAALGVIALASAAVAYRWSGGSGPTNADPRARGTPAVSVVTAPVEQIDFPVRRRSIGTLESPAIVVVKARLDSQVSEQHFKDGQLVSKGDLLFTLDDREALATIARNEAQLLRDKATLERATSDLARTRDLIAKNVAPQQQLDQRIADEKAAAAAVAAGEAQLDADRLRLSYTKIVAPIDGRVGAVRVTPGNLVSANDATGLVTITQLKPIRVSFTLPERDLATLRAALDRKQPTPVRVWSAGDSEPLATGRLEFVDSSVDVSSGTILAKANFANEDLRLWPGQYVDVEIDLDVRPATVVVPTVAIQTGQKGPYVFVAKPDHTAELRNVALGPAEGNRTAVVAGLNAGERVVVEGQLRLANGARLRETASEGDRRLPAASGMTSGVVPGTTSAKAD